MSGTQKHRIEFLIKAKPLISPALPSPFNGNHDMVGGSPSINEVAYYRLGFFSCCNKGRASVVPDICNHKCMLVYVCVYVCKPIDEYPYCTEGSMQLGR